MARIQCKGCDYKPDEHDSLEGYCLICAAERVKVYEKLAGLVMDYNKKRASQGDWSKG